MRPLKTILTNHLEYKLGAGKEFYQYQILDMGAKNKRELEALCKLAVESTTFGLASLSIYFLIFNVLTYQAFGHRAAHGQPAVNTKDILNSVWYAQEQLCIAPFQIYSKPVPEDLIASIVKQAAKIPEQARAFIENEGLPVVGVNKPSSVLTSFYKIGLSSRLLQAIGGQQLIAKAGSRWKTPNNSIFQTTDPEALNWVIVNAQIYTDIITDYGAQIRFQLSKCGYHPQQHWQLATIPLLATGSLKKKLQEAKTAGAKLVFFVVIQANVSVYAEFKYLSDQYFGIHSVCFVQKRDRNAEYFTNIMMKVNLKFSGTNHIVNGVLSGTRGKPSLGANTMILGADVVHSSQTTFDGCPSIAATVGSTDRFGARYFGPIRLQSIDKIDRELELWSELVAEYSARKLTDPTDRLPALAGVAFELWKFWGGTYLAGLWKESSVEHLDWRYEYSENHIFIDWNIGFPTWSWVAARCEVRIHIVTKPDAKLLDCWVEPLSQDVLFGQVRDASITLEAFVLNPSDIKSLANLEVDIIAASIKNRSSELELLPGTTRLLLLGWRSDTGMFLVIKEAENGTFMRVGLAELKRDKISESLMPECRRSCVLK